jgi:hypothetical protein
MHWPIRSEAAIYRLHATHQNASTFDAQTDAREKNNREIAEQQLSGAFPKRFRKCSFCPTLSSNTQYNYEFLKQYSIHENFAC